MGKNHLKRIAMPKSWPVKRKGIKFITRPNPGAHKFVDSMPLAVLIKYILGYANSSREIKFILNQNEVKINGKRIKEPSFAVGFMDVIEFPKSKHIFRISYTEGGLFKAIKIKDDEKGLMLCKITDKTGDSLLIEVPGNKVKSHLKLENGCSIYIMDGKQKGSLGTLRSVEGSQIIFDKGKKEFKTLKEYAFVVGKDKPLIEIN
jgi:small subunit ribosomal protein S4e